MPLPTIEWVGGVDGRIKRIDQTLLPNELKYVYCDDKESIYHAIKTLMVRGASAIGIAAAMGTVIGLKDINSDDFDSFFKKMRSDGYEGIIIKSMANDSVYQAGTRGWNWVKWKKEFVSHRALCIKR